MTPPSAPASAPASPPVVTPPAAAYWRNTRRLTLILLGIWFGLTFAVVFYARQLAHISVFGWPLSFYLAAQGVLLAYLAMIVIYARRMRQIEQQWQPASEPAHGN